jgi:hypothetical protein
MRAGSLNAMSCIAHVVRNKYPKLLGTIRIVGDLANASDQQGSQHGLNYLLRFFGAVVA